LPILKLKRGLSAIFKMADILAGSEIEKREKESLAESDIEKREKGLKTDYNDQKRS